MACHAVTPHVTVTPLKLSLTPSLNVTPPQLLAGGKDVRRHIQEIRAARNMPKVLSPSGSRPMSPTSFSTAAAMTPRTAALTKDVEAGEGINSPCGAGTSPGSPTPVAGTSLGSSVGTSAAVAGSTGDKSRPVSSASAGVLAETLEHTCPDGHASALEGHHPPQMADGEMLEEEEEDNMLEFKETASEVKLDLAAVALA